MVSLPVFVGTAGWSIPRASASAFPAEGTGLARYAERFNSAEINSTFYRSHRSSTYARWRDTVPPKFRFSVKVPKAVTHQLRLEGADKLFTQFVHETAERVIAAVRCLSNAHQVSRSTQVW